MGKINEIYERTYTSKNDIPILFVTIIFIVLDIYHILNKNYTGISVFSLFVVLLLSIYFRIPSIIIVSSENIQYGSIILKWEEINKIIFSADRAGTFIAIETGNREYTLLSRHFKDNKKLRKVMEDLCKEKNIFYISRDHGSYY